MSATKTHNHDAIEAGMRESNPAESPFAKGDMIREIPILFSTPMVQAIAVQKTKSQTRRTVGLDEVNQNPDLYQYKGTLADNPLIHVFARMWKGNWVETIHIKTRYGQPGDLLWVRESFKKADFPEADGSYEFKAMMENPDALWNKGIWKPSIHMPKAAARIWLQVEEIGVERLQDIKSEDAVAEGILPLAMSAMQLAQSGQLYFDYTKPKQLFNEGLPPFWSFNSLWCSINGGESWDANPWLWVVKFKVLSTTGKPAELC